ncbi:MAG: ferrous iron transporter [Cyanobacteriota bacterium]|jgi:ferrous iron transport protein B
MGQCHTNSAIAPQPPGDQKRVILIGQPNTGKSTFFNRLAKANAAIANWPGLTVDLYQSVVQLGDETIEVVDLPGIYDLNGFSDDERVVQRFLSTYPVHLIVVVINAAQIDRQLRLLLQVKALGFPVVGILNLADEAKRYGVRFDTITLRERLGVSLFAVSAKFGTGCPTAIAAIGRELQAIPHSHRLENLTATLANNAIGPEQVNIMLAGAVHMPSLTVRTITQRLDRILLHPVWGLPIFFASMFGVFWLIWTIGLPSADPVDWVTGEIRARILDPLLSVFPQFLQGLLLDGVWAGFAALLSFVPLVALFFIMMGLLEGSGYLARSAYLMDALMGQLGLDGRSFVLQMMGFGCNVPAIMGTRVMRSRTMRLLTMLIIPFSLCSARLQVFVFILAAVMPGTQGAIALFLLYLMSFGVGFFVAALLSRLPYFQARDPFVLELPPYRLPTIRQIILRVWGEMKEFVVRLSMFMAIGSSLIWFLTAFPAGATGLDTYAGQVGTLFQPLMNPLGINPYLTVSLIFGFVAKEVQIGALTVLYGLNDEGVANEIQRTVTFAQGFSYCLFSLIYIPCLTTLGAIWGEAKSIGYMVIAIGVPLLTAWTVSFVFYQGVHGLHWGLV